MRFQCEKCGKRYSLPDERVVGRSVRVRCKACGHGAVLTGPPEEVVLATPIVTVDTLALFSKAPKTQVTPPPEVPPARIRESTKLMDPEDIMRLARISAEGTLYTCLFASVGTDLRGPLRKGASDADLIGLMQHVWRQRNDRYSEIRGEGISDGDRVEMYRMGG